MGLAMEAAEFNEIVMERLEEKFFLSPKIWDAFDADQSGELTIDEFVEGMRNIDVYKDFRKERVPDDVMRQIVSDLAQRLFHEVDINMDGSLTKEELMSAFRRRREDALRARRKRQWFQRMIESAGVQIGVVRPKRAVAEAQSAAESVQETAHRQTRLKETLRRREWASEVD